MDAEIYEDLKTRIQAAGADTTIHEFHQLRADVEAAQDVLTPDHRGELDELLAQAFAAANSAEIGQQKPSIISQPISVPGH